MFFHQSSTIVLRVAKKTTSEGHAIDITCKDEYDCETVTTDSIAPAAD
jgi:hypothetical protein